jgi:hypothetical protein
LRDRELTAGFCITVLYIGNAGIRIHFRHLFLRRNPMPRILVLVCLLIALGGVLPGCGGSPDAPTPNLSDTEKQKKMEEAKAAMEKGIEKSMGERGAPPPGAR